MLKKVKKLKKGSVLITALIMIFLFSLLGWYFIYTTMTLMNQNQKIGLGKKAYYLADAGIQKSSEQLWNTFFAIGMVPNKITIFRDHVTTKWNEYDGSNEYYMEDLTFGENGGYKAYIMEKPSTTDKFSVTVTIVSTGIVQLDNGKGTVEKTIEADYKYGMVRSGIKNIL